MLSTNYLGPDEHYEWVVLPQGMANSPAFCQHFVSELLQPLQKRPQITLYIYMDDIIIGATNALQLSSAYKELQGLLERGGLHISNDKVQTVPPFKILGTEFKLDSVCPLKPQLLLQSSYSLVDLQKLLGSLIG